MDTTATPRKTASGRTISETAPTNRYLGLLGIQRVVPEKGDSQTELVVNENLVNLSSNMHGGAIFSLMDTCMSGALRRYIVPPEYSVTIECKINYLKAVKAGSTLLCTSSVLQRGGRVAVIESEIRDETDALVAKGLSTYMVMRPKAAPKA